MQINLRAKDVDLTPDLKEFTEKKIGSLAKFFDNVMEIRVELEKMTNHHKQGDIYQASVEMDVPGDKLFVKESSEDIKDAINKVKDQMQQKIKHFKGQLQAKRRDTAKEIRKMKEV